MLVWKYGLYNMLGHTWKSIESNFSLIIIQLYKKSEISLFIWRIRHICFLCLRFRLIEEIYCQMQWRRFQMRKKQMFHIEIVKHLQLFASKHPACEYFVILKYEKYVKYDKNAKYAQYARNDYLTSSLERSLWTIVGPLGNSLFHEQRETRILPPVWRTKS